MMAMIPSDVKTRKSLDTGGALEKLMIVIIALLAVDRLIIPHVHKALSLIVYVITALLVLYLVLPNKKNYGTSGYMRLLLSIKYCFGKIKDKVVRNQ